MVFKNLRYFFVGWWFLFWDRLEWTCVCPYRLMKMYYADQLSIIYLVSEQNTQNRVTKEVSHLMWTLLVCNHSESIQAYLFEHLSQLLSQTLLCCNSGGKSQYCSLRDQLFVFTPKIGEDSPFDSYFSIGLKPPTRKVQPSTPWFCWGFDPLKGVEAPLVELLSSPDVWRSEEPTPGVSGSRKDGWDFFWGNQGLVGSNYESFKAWLRMYFMYLWWIYVYIYIYINSLHSLKLAAKAPEKW